MSVNTCMCIHALIILMFFPQIMGPTKALYSYDLGMQNGFLCDCLGHCMLQLGTCQRLHVLPDIDKPRWRLWKILHRPSQQNGFTVSLLLQIKLIYVFLFVACKLLSRNLKSIMVSRQNEVLYGLSMISCLAQAQVCTSNLPGGLLWRNFLHRTTPVIIDD